VNRPIPQQDEARLQAIADELLAGLEYGVVEYMTLDQVMDVCNVNLIEAAWMWGHCYAADITRIAEAARWN